MRWRIFCYHTVAPNQGEMFARQIDFLDEQHDGFCSLGEGVDSLRKRNGTFSTVSFDDADRSVIEQAQPVLDRRGIRAALYLTTDYVLKGSSYIDVPARPAVDWDQLGRWIAAGHEIGSHTHTHANLTQCSPSQRVDELERSRRVIGQYLGLNPVHIAYPWGQFNKETVAHIRTLDGWQSAATIDRGFNRPTTDPFRLRRDLVDCSWRLSRLALHLKLGECPALYASQRRLRNWMGALKIPGGIR